MASGRTSVTRVEFESSLPKNKLMTFDPKDTLRRVQARRAVGVVSYCRRTVEVEEPVLDAFCQLAADLGLPYKEALSEALAEWIIRNEQK